MNQNSEQLVASMDQIRSKRAKRLVELSSEAERLTDWREHVRSAPLTAFFGSIVIGVVGAQQLFTPTTARVPATSQSNAGNQEQQVKSKVGRSGRWVDRLVHLALPMVVAAAKNQLANRLLNPQRQQQIGDTTHDPTH